MTPNRYPWSTSKAIRARPLVARRRAGARQIGLPDVDVDDPAEVHARSAKGSKPAPRAAAEHSRAESSDHHRNYNERAVEKTDKFGFHAFSFLSVKRVYIYNIV